MTFEGRVTGMAQCGDHVVPADNPLAQNPRHALPDDVGGATYRLEATGHGTAGTGHLCVAWLDSDGHRLDPSDHAHHVPHHAATAVVLAEFEVDTPYELEISWG